MEMMEIVAQTETALTLADETVIGSDEAFAIALENEKAFRAMLKEIGETFDPAIESTKESLNLLTEAKEKHAGKVEHALKVLKGKMIAYAEARKKVTQVQAQVAETEEIKKLRAEREELAQTLRDAGLEDEANALLNEPIAPSQLVSAAPAPLPKTKGGFRYRTNFTFTVHCRTCKLDVKARHLKDHDDHDLQVEEIPLEYWWVKWTRISAKVREYAFKTNIPGVTVIEEKV